MASLLSVIQMLYFLHIFGYHVIPSRANHLDKSQHSKKIRNMIFKRFLMDKKKNVNETEDEKETINAGFNDYKPSNDVLQQDGKPQIIYFAISGPINMTHKNSLEKLFHSLVNPNGCPVSASYFLPEHFTDYDVVKYFYDYNHDIGISGSYENAGLEGTRMAIHTDIPIESIKGFKTDSVESLDNNTIYWMSNNGYQYIASESCGVHRDGLRRPCVIDISKKSLDGIEINRYDNKEINQIPFNGIFLKDELLCSSSDTFASIHYNETKLFDFLWNEFKQTLNGNRAAFGLYLNTNLLLNDVICKAIHRFIGASLNISDVYVVSIKKMIEFLHSKIDSNKVKEFKPWGCKPTFSMEVQQKTNEIVQRMGASNDVSKNHAKTSYAKQLIDKTMKISHNGKETSETSLEIEKSSRVLTDGCYKKDNCRLPSCFCPTYKHYMSVSEIPQIVYFGFDDHLNYIQKPFYDKLFHSDRKNPNGCPISATLYISHVSTEYNIVKYFYDKGIEIGIHSINHTLQKTRDTLLYQASQQMNNIINLAGIPRDDILGWRSPYLETAGDIQVEVLQQLGFKYDISYLNRIFDVKLTPEVTISPSPSLWPFTLDSGGLPFTCIYDQCPKNAYTDFWIVPMNSFVDIKNKSICPMVDDCTNMPKNSAEVYEYVWNNFKVNYFGNRAPFGLHLHPSWFLKEKFSLDGLDKFIREMLKLKDVYIVSVKKMLDWVQHPTSLDTINMFKPWKCT